ncbi:hypothetical protein PV327_006907 [Microctonus hyperodae]|uniref:DUF4802 domain-containing protein n=1 Tax=Microctonus hyperodae TaxID=165561 RepID=A0AA39F586_MICHY|nr:hypothetical protein PV327_006907 [Microctonus hyperodae]
MEPQTLNIITTLGQHHRDILCSHSVLTYCKRLRPSTNNGKSDEQDDCDRNEVEDNTMVNSRISNGARDNETCLVLRGGKLTLHGPDIIHKSSKELYRAVAKQCGITCKMSDHCRCFDCQSHYFDCDYAKNEQDGGLGAGTPMFIAEVMHGTACILL